MYEPIYVSAIPPVLFVFNGLRMAIGGVRRSTMRDHRSVVTLLYSGTEQNTTNVIIIVNLAFFGFYIPRMRSKLRQVIE